MTTSSKIQVAIKRIQTITVHEKKIAELIKEYIAIKYKCKHSEISLDNMDIDDVCVFIETIETTEE